MADQSNIADSFVEDSDFGYSQLKLTPLQSTQSVTVWRPLSSCGSVEDRDSFLLPGPHRSYSRNPEI